MGGNTGCVFQFINRMFPGELEEPLHDAQSLRTAGLVHGLSPAATQRADEPTLIKQMIGATFDDVTLATMQMLRSGGELSRSGVGVKGDLFAALIVDP